MNKTSKAVFVIGVSDGEHFRKYDDQIFEDVFEANRRLIELKKIDPNGKYIIWGEVIKESDEEVDETR